MPKASLWEASPLEGGTSYPLLKKFKIPDFQFINMSPLPKVVVTCKSRAKALNEAPIGVDSNIELQIKLVLFINNQ
jgi:hypothetical protein